MELRLLSAEELRRALPMAEAIEAMRGAFRALHAGQVAMPLRLALSNDAGTALFMPAHDAGAGTLGQKVVTIFADNARRGLPVIHALVTLFDSATGAPLALLEGASLTALRTGAVTGLAADLLARPDAATLTLFGAGAQAPAQIAALCTVRPIRRVLLVSQSDSAARLAAQLRASDPTRRYEATNEREAAVRAADVIVTVTSSRSPVFEGAWVEAGTLVCGVGSFRPDMREVDATLLQRAAVVVDQRAAAQAEAGELIQAAAEGTWRWESLYGELGALVAGTLPPPSAPLCYVKSCGLAIEDVAAAHAALARAEQLNLGQIVRL